MESWRKRRKSLGNQDFKAGHEINWFERKPFQALITMIYEHYYRVLFLNKAKNLYICYATDIHNSILISKNNQKILIGYSDITILLHALYKKSGVKGIMGPMVLPQFAEFPKMQKFTELSFSYVVANLGTGKMYKLPAAEEFTEEMLYWDKEDNRPRKMEVNKGWSIINHGRANGVLIPANLNTVSKLIGTEYMLDWAGAILFLEDDDEESAATIQRMLQHLRQAGCLDKIKGIVFGRFQKASDIDEEKIHKILANVFGKIKFPVVANVDFGHTDPILSLPLGNEVFVNTEERKIEIKL